MSKFQPGRRVRKRGCEIKGVIKVNHENGLVGVQWKDGHTWHTDASIAISTEELILLKPRAPKPEARVGREAWIKFEKNGAAYCSSHNVLDSVLCREVLPGSITLSREQLEEAYKKAKDLWLVDKSDVLLFDVFLRLLGFNPSETA